MIFERGSMSAVTLLRSVHPPSFETSIAQSTTNTFFMSVSSCHRARQKVVIPLARRFCVAVLGVISDAAEWKDATGMARSRLPSPRS